MISRGASEMPPAHVPIGSVGVAWVGPRDEGLELVLAANGVTIVPEEDAAVIFLATPGADPGAHTGRPVVVTAPSADVASLTTLLRAGATDVYVPSAGPESLAKKLLRAARRR